MVPPIVAWSIPLIAGLVFINFGYRQVRKHRRVMRNGVTVEGTIQSLESSRNVVSTSDDDVYPIVRFNTRQGLLITKRYHITVSSFEFRNGEKVQIIYNPDDPEDFIIDSTFIAIYYMFLIGGIIPFVIGAYQVFKLL